MVHNWVQVTFDQHCRTPSWELVCIASCRRTFLLVWVGFFVLVRKPFSSHRDKLAFPLVLALFRLTFRILPLLYLHNIQIVTETLVQHLNINARERPKPSVIRLLVPYHLNIVKIEKRKYAKSYPKECQYQRKSKFVTMRRKRFA